MRSLLSLMAFTATLLTGDFVAAEEPAATYRANSQRTGHEDKTPGPVKPNVLWVMKAKEHYIAAPVVAGNRLFVSGLGGFNVPLFACLDTAPKTDKRVLWTKTTPALGQATVSSPAVVGDKLIFGDGMHQNNGGSLYCLDAQTGKRIWQLTLPGELIHLEGSPTVVGSTAFIGAGSGGVVAVDINKLSYAGKDVTQAEAKDIVDKAAKKLQADYEVAKVKNPMFAIPPSDDQLPKIAPKVLWQQGAKKWHVDAPIAVTGGKVLVGSAFLDKEKEGDRALICLDAATGATQWRSPLKLNPWGGAGH